MKKIYILAAASLALVSCSNNDDNMTPSQEGVRITAQIGQSATSRASETSWAAGDKIGISSSVGDVVGPFTNLQYTTLNGDGEFKGTTIFFYTPMTLTAYYPFTGTEGTVPGADGVIRATTYSANQEPAAQSGIDFLWDSRTNQDLKDFSAASPNINFVFSHKMSKIIFAFKSSEEVRDENNLVIAPEVKVSNIVAYEVDGLVMEGTFDTTTGMCAIDEDMEAENLRIGFPKGSVTDETELAPLIVFPQKPGNNKVKLHVYTDELDNPGYLQHYVCTLTFGAGELKPGNSYKYTIQISKVGLKLEKMTIVDWNTEREVNLTATVDGGVKNDKQ